MSYSKESPSYSKTKARQGYSSLRAKDPHDGGQWDLLISNEKMDFVACRGMGACKDLAFVVRPSLLTPRAIYRGVRDFKNDIDGDKWLCYTALPSSAFNHQTHERVPPWPGEVLLIFVTDERVIYLWYWAKADPNEPYLPVDNVARFAERVYLDKKG